MQSHRRAVADATAPFVLSPRSEMPRYFHVGTTFMGPTTTAALGVYAGVAGSL